MKTRELGNTGIEVSEIAFGGVEIGIPYGIGVQSREDMLSKKQAIVLLRNALDKGINFFDTARLYGESESIMGEAFQDIRDKVVLSTKCKHFKEQDGSIPAFSILKERIEGSLNESLRHLKTDYVDVFMLHQSDAEILNHPDVRKIFADLKSKGKIRAFGASTYSEVETGLAIEKNWELIQLPFNLLDQRHQQHFEMASKKGVGIIVRSVLMKGLLSDKGRNLHHALEMVENHIHKYTSLLDTDINSIASLATKFALSFPQVSSVLVGIDKQEYLEQAILAVQGRLFTTSQLLKAKALTYPDPSFLDLPDWERKGWLK